MTQRLVQALQAQWPGPWRIQELGASGFCSTWRADGPAGACFVKTLPPPHAATLEAEADGLQALASSGCVRVPRVLASFTDAPQDLALLVMEWLPLQRPRADYGPRLGRALAALHAAPAPGGGRFGWHRENRLGPTPQPNGWSREGGLAGWLDFLRGQRLLALNARLQAAGGHEELVLAVQQVADRLDPLFDDGPVPRPALLHGDLWLGNCGALADDEPVLYDPAVSVSDPGMELALLQLFGQPPAGFWHAYQEAARWTPDDLQAHERRRPVYQLYHLLNHVLVFGGGYGRQALAVAGQLLRPR